MISALIARRLFCLAPKLEQVELWKGENSTERIKEPAFKWIHHFLCQLFQIMHAQYFALINLNWNIQIWKNQLPAQILYPVTIPAEHHLFSSAQMNTTFSSNEHHFQLILSITFSSFFGSHSAPPSAHSEHHLQPILQFTLSTTFGKFWASPSAHSSVHSQHHLWLILSITFSSSYLQTVFQLTVFKLSSSCFLKHS